MCTLTKFDSTIALEEIKLLSEIIARQDGFSFQIKTWSSTISSAALIAIASKTISLAYLEAICIIPVINIFFLWIDIIHRVAMNRAIDRQGKIEIILKEKQPYMGPRIKESLSKPNSLKEQIKALNNVRMYTPYLIVSILSIILIIFSN